MRLNPRLVFALTCLLWLVTGRAWAQTNEDFAPIALGPLFDKFGLTLGPGTRTEAAGPFYWHEETPQAFSYGVPPLFSVKQGIELDTRDVAILPPLFTYHRFGTQSTMMLTPFFNIFGGDYQDDVTRKRTMVFPFYFRQRSSNTNLNYTAVFPFYGTVKGIFQRHKAFFVMFPIWSESWKRDVHTKNFLFPIFHEREGNGLSGWQVWPLAGYETKVPTTRTNLTGEVQVVPGHQKTFLLWPVISDERTGLGTTNAGRFQAFFPLFTASTSPARDSYSALWPLFSYADDREAKYRQYGFPWPMWVITRGEGKHITRFIPFYNYGSNNLIQSRAYLWPAYTQRILHTGPADITRTRVGLYLWSEVEDKFLATGETRRRQDAWPFMHRTKAFDGSTTLQFLAPLEPMLPANETVQRVFSPLWSVWRSSYNATNGATSQSVLWNLFRHDARPELNRWSCLFGLLQARETPEHNELRLFFIPIRQRRDPLYLDLPMLRENHGNAARAFRPFGSDVAAVRRCSPRELTLSRETSPPPLTRGATLLLPPPVAPRVWTAREVESSAVPAA